MFRIVGEEEEFWALVTSLADTIKLRIVRGNGPGFRRMSLDAWTIESARGAPLGSWQPVVLFTSSTLAELELEYQGRSFSQIRHDETEALGDICAQLEEHLRRESSVAGEPDWTDGTGLRGEQPVLLSRVIPQTALRRFYELLRGIPGSQDALARILGSAGGVEWLDDVFESSFAHFNRFQPRDMEFHPTRPNAWNAESEPDPRFARRLVQILGKYRHVEVLERVDFIVVDYEIDARRARRSYFEDGISGRASGTGGIDFVGVSADHHLVLAEVKAANDTSALLALIQLLTYASEMSTPNQRRRFEKAYRADIQVPLADRVDLYIVLQDTDARLLADTKQLLRMMQAQQELAMAAAIDRIGVLSASVSQNDQAPLFTLVELFRLPPSAA